MASRTSIQVSSSVHTLSSAAIGRGAFISASRRLAASACCSGVIGGRCGRAPGSCAVTLTANRLLTTANRIRLFIATSLLRGILLATSGNTKCTKKTRRTHEEDELDRIFLGVLRVFFLSVEA